MRLHSLFLALPALCTFLAIDASAQSTIAQDQRTLWVAHASFQTYEHGDYLTPMIVKALVKQSDRTPSSAYSSLIEQGLAARQSFAESIQYARVGRMSDPFQNASAIVSWAKRAAALTKNPIITGIAESADLLVSAGSAVNNHITALDQNQQLHFQALLYNQANKNIPNLYADAFDKARTNPRLSAALDAFLTAINVQIGDGSSEIKSKSPTVAALFDNQKILAELKSGKLGTSAVSFLEKNFEEILNQTKLTFEETERLRSEITKLNSEHKANEQSPAVMFATERQIAQERVNAAQATTNAVAAIVGLTDPERAQRLQLIGNSLVQTWDGLNKYIESSVTGSPSVWSDVVLMSNWVSAGITIINALGPEAQDSTSAILHDLNGIGGMISDLYTMTAQRFDRLEEMLDASQRQNMSAFRTMLLQGELTADKVDQIRQGVYVLHDQLSGIRDDIAANALSAYDVKFKDLQRQCYIDHLFEPGSSELSPAKKQECTAGFVNFALDVSKAAPLIDSGSRRVGDAEIADLLVRGPYERLRFLLQKADNLGYKSQAADQIGNPVVWSNSIAALASTIQVSNTPIDPKLAVNLRQLKAWGTGYQQSIESLFKDKAGAPSGKIFDTLFDLAEAKMLTVATEVNNVIRNYAVANASGVNPFAAGKFPYPSTAKYEEFNQQLPSKIASCSAPSTFIRTPPGLETRIDDAIKLAALLDPKGHPLLTFCYDLFTEQPRYYLDDPDDYHFKRLYRYYARGILSIYISIPDVSPIQLTINGYLPDMMFTFAPIDTGLQGWVKAQYVGEFHGGDKPSSLKWTDKLAPGAVVEWSNSPLVNSFSQQSWRGYKLANGDEVRVDDSAGIRSDGLSAFIEEKLALHRKAALDSLSHEMTVASRLKVAVAEFAGVKRLIHAYIGLAFPMTINTDVKLAELAEAALTVYQGETELLMATQAIGKPRQYEKGSRLGVPFENFEESDVPKKELAVHEWLEIAKNGKVNGSSIYERFYLLQEKVSTTFRERGFDEDPMIRVGLDVLTDLSVRSSATAR